MDRLALAVGLALFVVGLALRALGIGWGLGNELHVASYHPDERVIHLYAQQIEPAKLDFDPGFYNYGTLYLTLTRVASLVADGYDGQPAPTTPVQQEAQVNRDILAGRWLSALAGALLGWVVFALLYRRTHLIGAVMGGLAVTFAPGLMMHSRFQTVDVLMTLFTAVSLLWATRLIPREGDPEPDVVRLALWAGVFAGLSAGTKYSGVLAIGALFVILALRRPPKAWVAAGVGLAATLGTFLLTTPGVLKNTSKFMEGVSYELAHTAEGHGLVFAATPSGFVMHVFNVLAAYGLLLTALSLAGLGRGVWRKHAWLLGLAAFAVAYYVLIGRAEVKFLRYVFPLLPVLAVGFGWLMGQAHKHPNRKWRALVGAGVFGLASFGGLDVSLITSMWMMGQDPRDEAVRYLRKQVQPGETLGLVSDPWFYTPPVTPLTPLGPLAGPALLENVLAEGSPKTVMSVPPDPAQRFAWDVRLLTDLQPDYVVYSTFESDDVERMERAPNLEPKYQVHVDRAKAFREELTRSYEHLNSFGIQGPRIHDLMYVRPEIIVWKRRPDSTTGSSGSSTTSERPVAQPN